ncbi:hypothetical protein [Caulobacter sp. NIBR1757]|uniref:hypothetical protein n=1 Tax=Caulobacter sp. NIBR1757 TaxID=3016000 RepID=UPI0022EFDC43|nr:hypothetical protein [Caulobacter sp. NIBR1757]WGM41261.1 hypothetical protein AMEJIAPC_04212 [Caulobacter sp. NIBR1757]
MDPDALQAIAVGVFLLAGMGTYPLGAYLHARLERLHARGVILDRPVPYSRGLRSSLRGTAYVLTRNADNTPDRLALLLARCLKISFLLALASGVTVLALAFGAV